MCPWVRKSSLCVDTVTLMSGCGGGSDVGSIVESRSPKIGGVVLPRSSCRAPLRLRSRVLPTHVRRVVRPAAGAACGAKCRAVDASHCCPLLLAMAL